ncbi:MAG: cobalt-precorrin-5B (C(1))-methyltransferase CbiD [Muribaculaceae bacterium]|nr:cobalt-precorrin-5B (C(1))-methyltransferase CbiD [Muribaculaceae bacterium]
MILALGGTTEGRLVIKTLDEGEGMYYYSTFSDYQAVECGHGTHIHGAMSEDSMTDFCKSHDIRLIIDAAHPFATRLHATVSKVAKSLALPVIRFERRYPDIKSDDIVWCDNYDDAVRLLEGNNISRLLALTGVQTIERLRPYWRHYETFFRILDREESLSKAKQNGFPENRLVFYKEGNLDELISDINPEAIITKESGTSGGFTEKVETALQYGIKVFVVRRPETPVEFITVDGKHGLRREIERLLPEFYPLHTGFTTGSCATAAAKAALKGLLTGEKVKEISFRIPEGETMKMKIDSVDIFQASASASVIKDAGDDPDVTDKSRITVSVAFASHTGINFYGGEGIGIVTLPGLGLAIGEPAINPVPRKMIISELSTLYSGGLDVTISLAGGDTLADRTFNPRVGVKGGVSIIGTTGIVRPFSHEAFIESIRREIGVAIAVNCDIIIVNSGGKSERFMKSLYPEVPQQAFIHYGNAVGEIMQIARESGVKRMAIGLMLGKAVKLAEGHLDTHSHKITLNREFLKEVARQCGCSSSVSEVIERLNLARELPGLLSEEDAEVFFKTLLKLCHKHCAAIFQGNLEAVLIADDGKILSRIKS